MCEFNGPWTRRSLSSDSSLQVSRSWCVPGCSSQLFSSFSVAQLGSLHGSQIRRHISQHYPFLLILVIILVSFHITSAAHGQASLHSNAANQVQNRSLTRQSSCFTCRPHLVPRFQSLYRHAMHHRVYREVA